MVFDGLAGKADALVGHAIAGSGIKVDANHAGQFDVVTGFFEGFADGGLDQALVRVQMPGRLVEYCAVALELFNHQKAAIVFNDSGDGDVGFPFHGVILEGY